MVTIHSYIFFSILVLKVFSSLYVIAERFKFTKLLFREIYEDTTLVSL